LTAEFYISHFALLPHPEGGYYKETYRSKEKFNTISNEFPSGRNYSTAIYYLLESGDFSGFHKIRSDECWHYYAGDSLLIHIIYPEGKYECITLGNAVNQGEVFQFVVPANAWFASEPVPGSSFVLVGCTVSPGFDYHDFEMARQKELLEQYPELKEIISRLTRT
jgi:predicted cupin superfamily sugar epimerase